ncbi:MAG: hypothetical protein GWP19_00280 [Planctomycetia bacterium]|nr:hypothetical protein [Planctomycetia bacterium]
MTPIISVIGERAVTSHSPFIIKMEIIKEIRRLRECLKEHEKDYSDIYQSAYLDALRDLEESILDKLEIIIK